MSDEEILRYIHEIDDPVVGSSEIADEFDYSTNYGATKRLKQLQEKGYLDSKKLGRVAAWWITDTGRSRLNQES